jgi:hypothetical protein
MKEICIPHHDRFLNYSGNELYGSMAITANPRSLDYAQLSSRSSVDEAQMQWPVSHYANVNETSFLLPLHHAAQIYYLKHTLSHASALTISSVLHELQ